MPKSYQPGARLDHYCVKRVLGVGGSSRAYLALDEETGCEVVMKVPNDEEIGGVAIYERFRREAIIGRRLGHAGLQRHVNVDETRSTNYLVMEYVDGRPLREVMHERGERSFTVEEALRIVLPLCEVLAYVHKQGVIHQDVKPENILLPECGGVKLLDFGITTFTKDFFADHLTEGSAKQRWWSEYTERMALARHVNVMAQVGTPDYMAPERLLGQKGDIRADLYSVGLILYELLCAQLPFGRREAFEVITPQTSDDPPDILQWRPELSPALATVVMRTIRRDADKRYASMEALIYDLTHLEEVVPVAYVPDRSSLGRRYYVFIRLAIIILVVIVLIIGFGFLSQFAHHAVR